ncbi:MAG: hypothetical protein PHS37_02495 [Candidatus Omnitrophica bacterium]|nr:hypothetical protein [Candidatus Omnitrophota bacterium]
MKNISPVLSLVIQIAALLFVVIAFLVLYNMFLVDHSLDDLQIALNDIKSDKFGDADKLLSYALSNELNKHPPSTADLIALDYTKNVLGQNDAKRSRRDIVTILGDLISAKKDARGTALLMADRLNAALCRILRIRTNSKKRVHVLQQMQAPVIPADFNHSPNPILRKHYEATQLRLSKQYEKAAEAYQEIAAQYPNSNVAPLALFQAGAIYENDAHNISKAEELREKVKQQYPVSAYSFKEADEYAKLRRFLPMKLLKTAIRAGSIKFVEIMLVKATEKMTKEGIKPGEKFIVKATDKQITAVTMQQINERLKNAPVRVSDFRLKFEPGNVIGLNGAGTLGIRSVDGRASGTIWLLKDPPKQFLKYADARNVKDQQWVYFEIDSARIGPVVIPRQLVNELLVEAEVIFNINIPFSVQTMEFDSVAGRTIWQGPRNERNITTMKSSLELATYEEGRQ